MSLTAKKVKRLARLKSLAVRELQGTYRSFFAACFAGRVSARRPNDRVQSILVIRGDGGIGDFMLFLPALRVLSRHYASAAVSLLVGDESAELARAFASVDEIIPFNRKRYRFNPAYRLSLIRELRAKGFDLAINSLYSREPLTDELLYCSGARERILCQGNLNNIEQRTRTKNNLYCTQILPSNCEPMHELERNREFIERLTGLRAPAEYGRLALTLSDQQMRDAHALLSSHGLDPQRDFIVAMCTGAMNPIRAWPVERFAQLADRVVENFGARILLCGSASDGKAGESVSRLTRIAPTNLIGLTTLPQLFGVFRHSSLYIGNESGPLHLAAAAETPTVCILGGGHFGRFHPYPNAKTHRAVFETMPCYHCNWQCVYEVPHCIHDISVEKAWQVVRPLIEEAALRARSSAKGRAV